MHSLFSDLPQPGKGEYLETAAVCEDRTLPAHEFVQPALPGDHLLARANMEMVGISENDLGPKLVKFERERRP